MTHPNEDFAESLMMGTLEGEEQLLYEELRKALANAAKQTRQRKTAP